MRKKMEKCCNQNNRREFLKLSGAFFIAQSLAVKGLQAGGTTIKALVLGCIDYRYPHLSQKYLESKGYSGSFDNFSLAGGSLALQIDKFPTWIASFNEHVKLAKELHNISEIHVIHHRDCGAFKLVYGENSIKGRDEETKLHGEVFQKAKKIINANFPQLAVNGILLDIDGSYVAL